MGCKCDYFAGLRVMDLGGLWERIVFCKSYSASKMVAQRMGNK